MLAKFMPINEIPTVNAWWMVRGDGAMPKGVLPPCGVLVYGDGAPVAAAWMYEPHACAVVMIDWLVTKPGLSSNDAREACRMAINFLCDHARNTGKKFAFVSTLRPGMTREAKACGFTVAATECTHLTLTL